MNITFNFFVQKQPWELKKLHFGFYYKNRICIQVKQFNLLYHWDPHKFAINSKPCCLAKKSKSNARNIGRIFSAQWIQRFCWMNSPDLSPSSPELLISPPPSKWLARHGEAHSGSWVSNSRVQKCGIHCEKSSSTMENMVTNQYFDVHQSQRLGCSLMSIDVHEYRVYPVQVYPTMAFSPKIAK